MSTALRKALQGYSKTGFSRSFIVIFILAIASFSRAHAQGDLLISPLRLVFESNKKSQEISLANVGKDTATYAVSVVDIRMKDDGSFETITTPDSGQNFAGPFMRFFPRKVTLAPNESQVVKVQLMKTSQMQPGEYRSHLYFRAVPDEKPLGEKATKKDSGNISIQLKPIFGITIPVIIRVGEYTGDVTLSDMFIGPNQDNTKTLLALTFQRTGNMSVYGDMTVTYTSPAGKSYQMKFVKGIGVYTPNTTRKFIVELDEEKNFNPKAGKLKAVYNLQTSDKTPKTKEIEIELK